VNFVLGNSPEQLAALLPHLDRPLFWLDAHWSRRRTAGRDAECPLLEELAVIAAAGIPDLAILIDDARFFLEPPPSPHDWRQWPDFAAVMTALGACGDLYVAVKDDVILAVPASARADMVEFWRGQLRRQAWNLIRRRGTKMPILEH